MKTEVSRQELYEAMYNSLLFVDKDAVAGGAIRLLLEPDFLTVTVSNDYISLQQRIVAGISDEETHDFFLLKAEAKKLEEYLREDKNDVISVATDYGDGSMVSVGELLLSPEDDPHPELWAQIMETFSAGLQPSGFQFEGFAIHAARLQKLSLLKPQHQYPLHVVPVDVITESGEYALGFKYGPEIVGLISPLNLEGLHAWAATEGLEGSLW